MSSFYRTPLLLIPGMMCDARLFAPQITRLSGTRSLHLAPIIHCDTIEGLAADILAQAPEYFIAAGLSMGGIVAMEVFRQAPARVRGLILMDTNPKTEQDKVRIAREPQIERVQQGLLSEVMQETMATRYVAEGPHKQATLETCMAMALDLGSEVYVRQSRALQNRPDQQETLRHVRVPSLILCGREDQLCPPRRHALMHELIPGSHYSLIDGAGHLPTLEQPEATTRVLIDWLGSV